MSMETEMYFGGPSEDAPKKEFSEEAFATSIENESIGVLEDKLQELNIQIDTDKENEIKKKNAPLQGIPIETLTDEVKNAEKERSDHEKQRDIIKRTLKQKKHTPKTGGRLGSFLGF